MMMVWKESRVVRQFFKLECAQSLRGISDEDCIRIAIPEDITELRRTDPAKAKEWRQNVRLVFTKALANKRELVGFSENNEYILA